jgi:hypothetical protein
VKYRIGFKHTISYRKSLRHSVHGTTVEVLTPIRSENDLQKIEQQIRQQLFWIEDRHAIEILSFSSFEL